MANQYVNKLIKDGVTKLDLTSDTVTAATLKSGYTAHNAAGQKITGTMLSQSTTVTAATLKSGYTAYRQNGTRVTGTMLSQPTTVTAETLAEGITAYNAAGELITGSAAVSSWKQLQQKVRNNDMDDISIGDQYGTFYQGKLLSFDVIGKDIDTPANPNLSHALTLRVHSLLPDDLIFDEKEAFYACRTSALKAGTYYYNSGGTNYQFTLTQSVPVGGQLVLTADATDATLKSYASGSSTTPIETVSVTSGSSGTYIGQSNYKAIRGTLNSDYRRKFGSTDWRESAIRQWLNSNKPAGQWWTPQTPWDRPPAYAETLNGFMYDLDHDFLAVIGKTQVTTNYFNTSSGAIRGTYTTEDYFFLMSTSQVSMDYSGEGTKYTPYSNNASRIMYKNGSASSYWLRSPSISELRSVHSDGVVSYDTAYNSIGVVPACNII